MIEVSTLSFLQNLSQNNNREWFNANKQDYERARENVLDFTAEIITGISGFDKTVPADLNPKDCVMRIYRDIRFSNDKTPFKANFGIAVSPNGKNFKGSGYYIHVQPSKCFVGGGSWFPEGEELKAIRQEIDYNGAKLRSIIENPKFKALFGELDREGVLKTRPKGYSGDHENIELLKLKSFTATCPVGDKIISQANAAKTLLSHLEKIYPLAVFLRNAIS